MSSFLDSFLDLLYFHSLIKLQKIVSHVYFFLILLYDTDMLFITCMQNFFQLFDIYNLCFWEVLLLDFDHHELDYKKLLFSCNILAKSSIFYLLFEAMFTFIFLFEFKAIIILNIFCLKVDFALILFSNHLTLTVFYLCLFSQIS